MLPKDHKEILKHIIEKWKNTDGDMVKLDKNDDDYILLKNKLKLRKPNLTDGKLNDKLRTDINYLDEFKFIIKSKYIKHSEKMKYIPTPKGLEYNKCWLIREENYKWYINLIFSFIAAIVSSIITYFLTRP